MKHKNSFDAQRRNLLRLGAYAGASGLLAPFMGSAAFAREMLADNRILVVLELSGGNDGLNTVVPFRNDDYYKLRPKLSLKENTLRKIDADYGLNQYMAGMEKLYKDGKMAIIHGVGYPQPSFSHFNSMAYWHTAAPNSGASYGWVGRLADKMLPKGAPYPVVNIDATQSLAVRSREHVPIVFDDPTRFTPKGGASGIKLGQDAETVNSSRSFLRDIARSANEASSQVRNAWKSYSSPVDYGLVDLDLPKIASLIEARIPSRLYYTSFRNNAFDTHVAQPNLHSRLLTYFSDAVYAFMQDMERIGRADDVTVLVFSEFGRRAEENANLGTDHGTANVMFAIGNGVNGGHYGTPSSLTDLDETDNLIHTTDFRRVLSTVIEDWLQYPNAQDILNGKYDKFGIFS
ncbi:DUF1501 domain-containing protein [Neptuniibacter sp.]|uniref:DUF1501 domain-containing protein n=1 Tax=Neptuniibacter sp. TaxID=1962643 RepID=UPI003B5AAAD6